MQINPVSITIHLSRRYQPAAIWDFLLHSGLKGRFEPLYIFRHNEVPPVTADEVIEDEFRAAVYRKEKAGLIDLKGLDTGYKPLCGSFKMMGREKGETRTFAHFLMPSIGQDGNKSGLALNWSHPEPALLVIVNGHQEGPSPLFYTGLDISHGIWGHRHKWLRAMRDNLLALSKHGPLVKAWSGQGGFLDSLAEQAESMERAEEQVLDCGESRSFFLDLTREVMKKFSDSGQAVLVSPCVTDAKRPFDLPVNRFGELPAEWSVIPENAWTDLAWNECLRWDAPGMLNESAMRYWIDHPDEERFLRMTRPALGGGKSCWPSIVGIMTKRKETERMIIELANWTADINWPGAGEAWTHLLEVVGERALPVLDRQITVARHSGDQAWEGTLRFLKKAIEGK